MYQYQFDLIITNRHIFRPTPIAQTTEVTTVQVAASGLLTITETALVNHQEAGLIAIAAIVGTS